MKIFKDPVAPKEQLMLLPPCVGDFVAQDDPVRVLEEIIDKIDLSGLGCKYRGGGAPAYDPRMMLKVLVFGYCQGIRSSRKLDAALGRDLRFMYLARMSRPDFRTIARFRRENLDVIGCAFKQTVEIAIGVGIVLLEHVSLDGTKIEANVSGRYTFKKGRLEKALEGLGERIGEILQEAELTDEEEDRLYGEGRGDELPKELRDARRRQQLLEDAKKHLEESGRGAVAATDLESRVMKTKSGNRPAYNAQAVVDKERQVIVAADVVQEEADNHQMPAMMEKVVETTGCNPFVLTVDGGYFSEDTLQYAEEHGLDVYIPDNQSQASKEGFSWDKGKDCYVCPGGQILKFYTVRQKRERIYRVYRRSCATCPIRSECCGSKSRVKEIWHRVNGELHEKMLEKMRTQAAKSIYRLRKQIVEPVFGNIKENRGLCRLLLRGLDGAKIEYLLGCIGHNISKITPVWPRKQTIAMA